MKRNHVFFVALAVICVSFSARTQDAIPLSSEPHHHLALHNAYVNIYQVDVAPNDTVLLHRHDHDVLAITLGNTQVTTKSPGKPDAPQKLADGQLRLQPLGMVHSTYIDGPDEYRAVAVELMNPEQNAKNRCAMVIPGQPLNCPSAPSTESKGYIDEPQYQSDQTFVMLVRVLPHQQEPIAARQELFVSLDSANLAAADGSKQVQPGDFEWMEASGPSHIVKNDSDKEARFMLFAIKAQPAGPTSTLAK